jgi:hypothetical protein
MLCGSRAEARARHVSGTLGFHSSGTNRSNNTVMAPEVWRRDRQQHHAAVELVLESDLNATLASTNERYLSSDSWVYFPCPASAFRSSDRKHPDHTATDQVHTFDFVEPHFDQRARSRTYPSFVYTTYKNPPACFCRLHHPYRVLPRRSFATCLAFVFWQVLCCVSWSLAYPYCTLCLARMHVLQNIAV